MTDIADAVIMVRLFGELWEQGVVVVATSNRAPSELYLDGINRPYFLPFIDLLQRQCLVVSMDSETDHRQAFQDQGDVYFFPLSRSVKRGRDPLSEEKFSDRVVKHWGTWLPCLGV